jgi:transcriptional regulator with XRE-family HTH domain
VRSAEPNFTALRNAVRSRKNDLGLTHDALAEASGLNRRSVIRLLSGEREGTLAAWFAVANALELDLGQLVGHLYDSDAASPKV